MVGRQLFH